VNEAPVPENEAGAEVVLEEPRLPGATLRAAREAKGLLPEAVAQITRFSVRQIEALERDDYASLPGITAVRGFVRGYAKFLKLDAEPLLAALDLAAPMSVADVRAPTKVGEAEQPRLLQRVTLRRAAIAMAGLVLLLSGFWYIIRPGSEALPSRPQAVQLSLEAAVESVASPSLPVMAPPSVATAIAPPAPIEGVSGSPSVVATTSAQGLRLEFAELSWIEIRDATQKVIFSGEYPAGTRQNVEGKAPFQLWIGKASGVKVFSGERSIDLKPYTREDVARLTVE